MSFSRGTKTREQAGAQISHPYETVGPGAHNRVKEVPHHGKGCVTHQSLVLGRQAGCRPFATLQQPGQSVCHAARLMKDNAQVLEGCRPRENMLPNMPRVRAAAIEDNNLCL